jgi:hypothetical protein
MKCLSQMQPFASLVALGAKRIETRSRDFTGGYRGPLAIHASKGKDYMQLCDEEPFRTALAPLRKPALLPDGGIASGIVLPLGCIVAVGDLVEVKEIIASPQDEHGDTVMTVYDHLERLPGWTWTGHMNRVRTELAFGDYSPRRYMYMLRNVYALPKPILAKGSLGLWEFDLPDPRGEMKRG